MAIAINGAGTITGIIAGGLPDDSIVAADIATNAVTTIILSAIGSNNSPNFDSSLYSLAKRPSKKSVKLANTNIKKGIKSPKKPGR